MIKHASWDERPIDHIYVEPNARGSGYEYPVAVFLYEIGKQHYVKYSRIDYERCREIED
jgi:hypothetical protein